MKDHNQSTLGTDRQVSLFGMWVSIVTAIMALAALAIAITTAPARSGPNCQPLIDMGVLESCVTYPYTNVAAWVPIEYIWMYPATALSLLFVALLTALCHTGGGHKKLPIRLALYFSIIAAAVHGANYFIQLAVVQPALLKGELDSLVLWSQYNPHGIFIALENLGYFMMGLAFLLVAFGFARDSKLERAIRYILMASAIVVVAGLPAFSATYRSDLEYRYEVLSLTVDWLVFIVTGVLLSIYFRRVAHTSRLETSLVPDAVANGAGLGTR